jgi:predicted dehydrogenase
MHRRTFFAASMSLLAAPSDRIRLAIIGSRGRGRALAADFVSLPNVEIAALADPDPRSFARAHALISEKSGRSPQTHSDLRRVLDDKTIDAVVIATPDHWHAPATLLACAAGKDVYVEKPCSHNVREGRLMIEAAQKHKRIVQVGTQSRSRASTQQAIALARSGKLGRIRMAKAWNVQRRDNIGHKPDSTPPPGVDFDLWTGPAPLLPFRENRFHYTWHWWWNYGTGDMGNDGVHQLDIARWGLGVEAPTQVSGWGAKVFFDDDQQTPDSMNITFTYPGGEALIFEQRIWNPYGMSDQENGVALYGSDAMLEIGRWQGRWGYRLFDAKGKLVETIQADNDETHARNFIDCLRSHQSPNAAIPIGHTSTLHCHLGNIVARTGRHLRFDPATDSIPGDPEAAKLLTRSYRSHWATPQRA